MRCWARVAVAASAIAAALLSASPAWGTDAGAGEQPSAIAASRTDSLTDPLIASLPTDPPAAKAKLRIVVVRLRWAGNPSDHTTDTTLKTLLARYDRWLRTVSRGALGTNVAVAPGWLTIDVPKLDFSPAVLGLRALKKAHPSLATGGSTRYVYYFPEWDRFDFAGISYEPGTIVELNGTASLAALAHEEGHNFGLDHSRTISCTAAGKPVVYRPASCTVDEYGDPYSVMGGQGTDLQLPAIDRYRLGWLPASQAKTFTGGTHDVALVPLSGSSRGVQLVSVKTASECFRIEYRARTGLDRVITANQVGVQVRTCGTRALIDFQPYDDVYLDEHPNGGSPSAALPVGATWTSPGGIRIALASQTTDAARLRIRFGAGTPKAPAAVAAPTFSGTTLQWKRPADNGTPVTRYVVTLRAEGSADRVYELPAGGTTTRSLSLRSAIRSGVAYTASVVAVNDRGTSPAGALRFTGP